MPPERVGTSLGRLGGRAMMMSGPLIMGLDSSPTRLGWGVVRDEDGLSAACGVHHLDGSPEAVRGALRDIERRLADAEVSLCYVEEVYPPGRGMAYRTGIALGYVEYAVRARWPWAPIARVTPARWRSVVGIGHAPASVAGRGARREWLKTRALVVAEQHGFTTQGSDDAAEGALIALAAWRELEAGQLARRVGA